VILGDDTTALLQRSSDGQVTLEGGVLSFEGHRFLCRTGRRGQVHKYKRRPITVDNDKQKYIAGSGESRFLTEDGATTASSTLNELPDMLRSDSRKTSTSSNGSGNRSTSKNQACAFTSQGSTGDTEPAIAPAMEYGQLSTLPGVVTTE
jgi:hypothetical protein